MEALLIILIIQFLVLFIIHLLMYPTDNVRDFLKRKFGTYDRALIVVNGTQIALIFVVTIFIILIRAGVL